MNKTTRDVLLELRNFIVLHDDEGLVMHTDMIERADKMIAALAQNAPTYTREDVQQRRDDVANAAADMVAKALLPQDKGWQWLVDSIRALGAQPKGEKK